MVCFLKTSAWLQILLSGRTRCVGQSPWTYSVGNGVVRYVTRLRGPPKFPLSLRGHCGMLRACLMLELPR